MLRWLLPHIVSVLFLNRKACLGIPVQVWWRHAQMQVNFPNQKTTSQWNLEIKLKWLVIKAIFLLNVFKFVNKKEKFK